MSDRPTNKETLMSLADTIAWAASTYGVDRALVCLIDTGTYTGDGTLSQPITGIGFRPRLAWIFEHETSETATLALIKIDQFDTEYSVYMDAATWSTLDNRLISLDADGFTVDDDGVNAHPNKDGTVYDYIALG